MNKEFGRIITNLRKSKGLSQKDAASELGISQALLSHYEKGIRECGLSFLVRTADLYDVSVDYLLGRTPNPSGGQTVAEDIPEIDELSDVNNTKSNTYCLLNRKLIVNSAAIIYSLLSEINNKKLSKHVTDYLGIAEYRMFRYLYSLKENNASDVFGIENNSIDEYCVSSMALSTARINNIKQNIDGVELSADVLSEKFSESYTSLRHLIKNAEKTLEQNFKI
ncbi:MAG: helix-turn-helix transcriptional regulator [Ruminococcus sp.]|nr:helix-turn-helix transcriptional regulator [Ruminococcus sp.]